MAGKNTVSAPPTADQTSAAIAAIIEQLLGMARKATDALPPDFKPADLEERLSNAVNSVLSPERLAALKVALVADVSKLVTTGKGPVQKSASDLVG